MKKIIVSLLMLTMSLNVFACMPKELEGKSLQHTYEEDENNSDFKVLENTGLKITDSIRLEVNKVIEINGDTYCSNEQMAADTFMTKKGTIYHAVYTADDHCDGGNSYGVVLNANLEQVAAVQDSDFYCPKK